MSDDVRADNQKATRLLLLMAACELNLSEEDQACIDRYTWRQCSDDTRARHPEWHPDARKSARNG